MTVDSSLRSNFLDVITSSLLLTFPEISGYIKFPEDLPTDITRSPNWCPDSAISSVFVRVLDMQIRCKLGRQPGWESLSNVDLIECQDRQHTRLWVINRWLIRSVSVCLIIRHHTLPELVFWKQHLLVVKIHRWITASQSIAGQTQPLAPQPPVNKHTRTQ